MSGLNLIPVQDAITAYVRQEFPNYEVREDVVLDDEAMLKESNSIKPYIVLRWGGMNRLAQGGSFAGVRFDEYVSSVDVNVVAPTPNQARRGSNVLFDKLVGWKPTGVAPLVPDASTQIWAVENNAGRPHVYVASFGLSFAVNNIDPGSYIAH
jgi:hypothetical protein